MNKFKHLTILIALYFITQAALAQTNPNIIRIGGKTFSAGLYAKPFRMEKVSMANVNNANALFVDWAVCIEMCLNYAGLNVSQDQVMTLVNGKPSEPEGSPQDLTFAINKTTPTSWGKPAKVFCEIANMDADVLFDELSAGQPLIYGSGSVGKEGRAFVVTGLQYTINYAKDGNMTGITPVSVTMRDPWPNGATTFNYLWSEFLASNASLYTIKLEFKK